MGDLFFTADTHFGHRAILVCARRPFASVEEMDEALIERWNDCVRPGDRVYHLGDFAVCWGPKTGEILDRLHGEIHLVWGNHDRPVYAIRDRLASYHDYLQVTVELLLLALLLVVFVLGSVDFLLALARGVRAFRRSGKSATGGQRDGHTVGLFQALWAVPGKVRVGGVTIHVGWIVISLDIAVLAALLR